MYALLLLLGALTAAAGLALVAVGATVHDGAFAPEIATPGTVAAVGGLILIGLGLAVRELQRIERTLAARPMPRPARPGEAPAAPARVALPQKPKAESHAQPAPSVAAASPAPAEDAAFERLREKFPTLVRLENVPPEATDASLLVRARVEQGEEEVDEVKKMSVGGRAQATAPARAAPRLDTNGRQPGAPGAPERKRGSVFEGFWPPPGQRPRRNAATAAAPIAAPAATVPAASAAPVDLAQGSEAAPDAYPAAGEPPPPAAAAAAPEPAAVSILKSGVVEGMAYALYSDGSIEAQLPQGRLRFGSITELRHHIENDS